MAYTQETSFTGKAGAFATVFLTVEDAALSTAEIVSGEDAFLSRAYTRISVRRTPEGWAVRVDYRKPQASEASP